MDKSNNKNDQFLVTFVYGYNDDAGRSELWKYLLDVANKYPWIVLGDFNDILAKEEKIGKRVKYTNSNSFLKCINDSHMEDIKFNGNYFTWRNK